MEHTMKAHRHAREERGQSRLRGCCGMWSRRRAGTLHSTLVGAGRPGSSQTGRLAEKEGS